MTIYHRLKVWAIKGYRFLRYAFVKTRGRTTHMIFMVPTAKICDYCDNEKDCIIFECDYEVYASICRDCLNKALHVFQDQDTPVFFPPRSGVVIH